MKFYRNEISISDMNILIMPREFYLSLRESSVDCVNANFFSGL